MNNTRIGCFFLGVAVLVCGVAGLAKSLGKSSEEDDAVRWREFFGDFYADEARTREVWDIPLDFFPARHSGETSELLMESPLLS